MKGADVESLSPASMALTALAVIVLIVGVCGDVIMAAVHWLKAKP
jgi:hypothetical protein